MTMGEQIKKLRAKAGMSQWKLAEACGVSDAYIAMIEQGRRKPSFDVQKKISMALPGFKAVCPACGKDVE